MTRLTLLATLTVCGVSMAQEKSADCSNWHVRKLDRAPDWYLAAVDAPMIGSVTKIGDSLERTDYVLNDSVTLVQYQHETFEALNEMEWDSWFAPGSLYLCGRDTVLLDSCAYGYSELSFSGNNRMCVAKETEFIGPDGGTSAIVQYDLVRGTKTVLRSYVVGVPPRYEPVYLSLIAYTDFADLYIVYPGEAGELVFSRGGGYAQEGECRGRWINDVRWSPDGRSLVFKYYDTFPPSGDYELWEASWSR